MNAWQEKALPRVLTRFSRRARTDCPGNRDRTGCPGAGGNHRGRGAGRTRVPAGADRIEPAGGNRLPERLEGLGSEGLPRLACYELERQGQLASGLVKSLWIGPRELRQFSRCADGLLRLSQFPVDLRQVREMVSQELANRRIFRCAMAKAFRSCSTARVK